MNRRSFIAKSTASLTAALVAAPVFAEQAAYTWVFVKDMHCSNCAKKIARRLYTVPGVVKVQTDVKKDFAVITPQAGKNVSPKRLWEAVEAADFEPVKIQGPAGIFTDKPPI